jgi:HPt (histidine-containing phosphotransfer) domain-containing protein
LSVVEGWPIAPDSATPGASDSGADPTTPQPVALPHPLSPLLEPCAVTGQMPAHAWDLDVSHDRLIQERVFNYPEALARARGKLPLLKQIVSLFLTECPTLLSELRCGIASNDNQVVERSAHRLKGSAGSISAYRVLESALRLEQAGRSGALAHANATLSELEREVVRLEQALNSLREADNP